MQEQLSNIDDHVTGDSVQEIVAISGITPRYWRLYAFFWLVCLFFPILFLARTPLPASSILIALSGLVIFVAIYTWVMWPYPLGAFRDTQFRRISPWVLVTSITLLALILSLAFGSAFTWLFIGASAVTGVTLSTRRAFWLVSGLTLLTLGVSIMVSGGFLSTEWLQVIPLVLLVRGLGLDVTGLTRLAETLRELNLARQELARQAVTAERLRMARDLHDLLGHTLSLITIKSELAGRLVEKDAAQAVQEIHEVEQVARQALREVRQAVAGYRQQSLLAELDGARQILESAGITCRIEYAGVRLPPAVDTALAWVVREGVTNVIRHSRAKHCRIRIDSQGAAIRAEVVNDGYREPRNVAHGRGSGLSGMAERLAALKGKINAGPISFENRPGFQLMVEIPVQGKIALQEAQ